ncbi:hypothetical protein V1477_011096 [Vespula maculifrons]|uniref:Uncharacterized protein n=1 Tax=Vespula maculifrons TaxID=7453 RepID=A0ABD2C3U2_VESMC
MIDESCWDPVIIEDNGVNALLTEGSGPSTQGGRKLEATCRVGGKPRDAGPQKYRLDLGDLYLSIKSQSIPHNNIT